VILWKTQAGEMEWSEPPPARHEKGGKTTTHTVIVMDTSPEPSVAVHPVMALSWHSRNESKTDLIPSTGAGPRRLILRKPLWRSDRAHDGLRLDSIRARLSGVGAGCSRLYEHSRALYEFSYVCKYCMYIGQTTPRRPTSRVTASANIDPGDTRQEHRFCATPPKLGQR
jgi:hypothetical protein